MLNSQRGAMSAIRCAGALTAILCSFGAQSSAAQEAGAVTVDVGRCIDLESAEARLACFGSEVNAVLEDQAEAQAGKNPAATREADAGVPAPGTEVPSGSDVRPNIVSAETHSAAVDETGDAEYSGTIVEFHERLPNAYLITLDNGQVWLQTEPKQYPLRPGLDVRIYPTSWGDNYRLHGLGTGSHIQVRRVR